MGTPFHLELPMMRRSLLKTFTAAAATAATLHGAHPARACMPYLPVAAELPSNVNVLATVLDMPNDQDLQRRASQYDLNVLNVMWEDTGRFENSAVGPNISDLTLQVREDIGRGRVRTHMLPVIRHPNFSDRTGDVAAEKLFVRVGNQRKGGGLTAVPIKEVLANLREYLTDASSLKGSGNFLAPRDSHMLVSAQHVFIPLPQKGKVEFNPVLFNYQSQQGAPGVLTLLVTREGLSATVIENRPGDQNEQGYGQQLFFNKAGQKTPFTAERKSAVKARVESGHATSDDAGALEEGADMMMIVQIPLKLPRGLRGGGGPSDGYGIGGLAPQKSAPAAAPPAEMSKPQSRAARSDVEAAVLGHGKELGRFTEINGLKVERDERFPIRVTVQFYKATSNGVVNDADLSAVNAAIEKVYQSADYVGSLVVPNNNRNRPTDWIKDQPAGSWGVVSN
jgi:hypothetical protein